MSVIPAIVFQQHSPQLPYVRPTLGAFNFTGAWSISVQYGSYDVVTQSGNVYVALTPNIGATPASNPLVWGVMVPSSGGVSNVAMTVPSILSVSGSPITTTGTFAVTLATQNANTMLLGPTSGAAATPAFRALVGADMPNLTINTQVGTTYAIAATDKAAVVTFNNAASVAVSIAQATGSFGAGWYCEAQNLGAGVVTITPATSTIDSGANITLKQGESISIVSAGGNYICLRSKIRIATADLPGGTTGSGAVVLATSPTIATPTLTGTTNTGNVIINPSSTGTGAALTVGGTSTTTGGISVFVGASGAQTESMSVVPADGSGAAARVGSLSVRTPSGGFLTGAEVAKISTTGAFTGRGGVVLQTTSGTLPATIANDTAGGISFTNNAGGSIQFGNGGTLFLNVLGGGVRWSGATSGTTVLQASAVAGAGTLTLPTGTATLAVVPTLTLKKGSGAGNYTSTSLSAVQVDATNLAFTVTIPTGWKLGVQASGSIGSNTGAVTVAVSITDGGTKLQELSAIGPVAGGLIPFSLSYVINGDGAAHTIDLRYFTTNASDAVAILNGTSTQLPTMVFTLSPSN